MQALGSCERRRSKDFVSINLGRPGSASSQITPLYTGYVVAQRAKTIVEWAERMRSAGPPTEDDVTVLLDGRRLNSRETVEAWLKEVEAIRVLEATTRDSAL